MIKQLPVTFRKSKTNYTLIRREGDYAIYSLKYSENLPVIGFDVVVIRKYSPNYETGFLSYNDSEKRDLIERYPTSEEFGSKGWSFCTLNKAVSKFQELLNVPVSK